MKILVGVDGGDTQRDALDLARRFAAVEGSRLVVAHVYPSPRVARVLDPLYERAVEAEAERILLRARGHLGRLRYETRAIPASSVPRALHRLAREERCDVLVLGSCHRGPVGRAVLGSVAERVVDGAPCPVVVAPRRDRGRSAPLRSIAVAYDGRAESEVALAWAQALAERAGATLTVLHAYQQLLAAPYPGVGVALSQEAARSMEANAQAVLARALDRLPSAVQPSGRLLEGPVARSLAEVAEGFDLLVAGSRGYGPVAAVLLGSTSRRLLHAARCPVVVLPRGSAVEDEDPVPAHTAAVR